MTVAICNFARFKIPGGGYTAYAYQNFFVNQAVTYSSVSHAFTPFGVTNGGGKRGGDRSSAVLAAAPGPISINVFAEACDNRYILEVKTVEVDVTTLSLQSLISTEMWFVTSMESTIERAVLKLSSPLDAADGQAPRRYLSSELVGSLPITGNLVLS
jgi:hypothetical protein